MILVHIKALEEWLFKASLGETTWFKPRKELWHELKTILISTNSRKIYDREAYIKMEHENLFTIKDYLLTRNDQVESNQKYAYEKTIAALTEQCDSLKFVQGNHAEERPSRHTTPERSLRSRRDSVESLSQPSSSLKREEGEASGDETPDEGKKITELP
jgi:hypothetical protein